MAERLRNEKGAFLPSHGMRRTRIYSIWCTMKGRCNNPNSRVYNRYGGRGIRVCAEWQDSFNNFYEWAINNGYSDDLTIDRINNDKGYSPGNCRWATKTQQNRNYSRNHLITYQGKTQCIADWSDDTGINRATILFRLHSGKKLDEVFDKRDGRSLRHGKGKELVSETV